MNINWKSVLLLKSPKTKENDPYVEALMQPGELSAHCMPVLGFSHCHQTELQAALSEPHSGLILTSPRAVDAVISAVGGLGAEKQASVLSIWSSRPCYVVGQATGEKASQLGLHRLIGQNSGSGEKLVPLILADAEKFANPLLFPCGNLRRETIPNALKDHGVGLTCVTVYQTSADRDIRPNLQQYQLHSGGVCGYMVFFSPSGVNYTVPVLRELGWPLDDIHLIAMGPTTEAALLDQGLCVAGTAPNPTPGDVLNTIQAIRKQAEEA